MPAVLAVVVSSMLAVSPARAGSKLESRNARTAICRVWGRYCTLGIAIASCESHFYIWARNGQYLGMFQMGSRERQIYGHGNDVWSQARAAYKYFLASGTSPWSSSRSCW